jgi:hypothetical protein
MPYVKPSVNIAVHIVTSIKASELLKPANREENVIVSDEGTRVKFDLKGIRRYTAANLRSKSKGKVSGASRYCTMVRDGVAYIKTCQYSTDVEGQAETRRRDPQPGGRLRRVWMSTVSAFADWPTMLQEVFNPPPPV